LDAVYSLTDDNVLVVNYDNHGPFGHSGSASFDVKLLDDGTYLFLSRTPLWSDDYKTRNNVVVVLDGVKDGYYYDEACGWLTK
jgi:hypothetical protein